MMGQTHPDKIIIIKNTYHEESFFETGENIISSDTLIVTDKKKINQLFSALTKYDTQEKLLSKFGIDTNFIKNNPNQLLKLYDGRFKKKIDWNQQQKEFIYKKLTDPKTYFYELNNYITKKCIYNVYHNFLFEYIILSYYKDELTSTFTSNKSKGGYYFPYVDQSKRIIYNFKIDNQINKLFNKKSKSNKMLQGKKLLNYIINKTIEDNIETLFKLSAFSYEREISELATDFEIISSEEVYGRGRYTWNEIKTIKVSLKNKYMLPNVYMQFLISEHEEKLYSRDSIKKDYKKIISQIQDIPFIKDYLQRDASSKLDIYYFNNSGINNYNIDAINKNPIEWKKQDEYIESLKWYEKNNIEPKIDIEKAIQTSEKNYCGCNYKFEKEFIEKAIFFEITSNINANSICFLLPDNTILLYYVGSYDIKEASVFDIKMNDLGNKIQLPFACLRFDRNGNLIDKK
jgi:hypothetical protein